jgi:hypothetical protein
MANFDIVLPPLHTGQRSIFNERARNNVVCCGRRFGKTTLMEVLAASAAVHGKLVGLFTPEHKQLNEPYDFLRYALQPATRRASKTEGTIKTTKGGCVDFWALNDNELAGRGREYDIVCIDEAAFTKNDQMLEIWRRSIKPTMLTTRGIAWVFSTPNGIDPDNFFYRIWHDPELGFKQHHAPTSKNPFVPIDELENERTKTHPLVWQQEFEAQFISWDNATFFKLDYLLDANKQPVEYPTKCDLVFAVMDCAVKSGTNNDATAIVYFAYNRHFGTPLTILDYELHSIEAASLVYLMPQVLQTAEKYAQQCGTRMGSLGCFVEDAAGGSVLLQYARAQGWPVRAIDSKLMMMGKDNRAMLAGGPAHAGLCKISKYSHDKLVEWHGRTMNHLLHQVTTFRVGDKDAAKRADDALDCFTYGIAIALTEHKAL